MQKRKKRYIIIMIILVCIIFFMINFIRYDFLQEDLLFFQFLSSRNQSKDISNVRKQVVENEETNINAKTIFLMYSIRKQQ